MLPLIVSIQSALIAWAARLDGDPDATGETGQATAEYALVLLGAAAIALLIVAWASDTNRVSKLLDAVIDKLLSHVS